MRAGSIAISPTQAGLSFGVSGTDAEAIAERLEKLPEIARAMARQMIFAVEKAVAGAITVGLVTAVGLTAHPAAQSAIPATLLCLLLADLYTSLDYSALTFLVISSLAAALFWGADSTARRVEIRWPSGIVQKLENVKAGQMLKVTEPTS